MTSMEKLAKMFNDRNNSFVVNITTGNVLSVSPLKIQWGDSVILSEVNLVLSKTITNATMQIGNKVIMVPDNDYKIWYILDKVG